MKKALTISAGLVLVLGGALFEIFYYQVRFVSEGDHAVFAAIKGVGLFVLLLSSSTLRKDWRAYFLIVPLLAFSVWCTSAGQASNYAIKRNTSERTMAELTAGSAETEERRIALKTELEETRGRLSRKEDERDSYSPSERQQWSVVGKKPDGTPIYEKRESTVFSSVNAEIEAYRKRIEQLEVELKELPEPVVTTEKRKTDPFEIVADRLKIPAIVAQMISQSFFSLFSALMAPFGINLLLAAGQVESHPKPKAKKEQEPPFDWLPLVTFWVTWSWYPVRNKKGTGILPERSIMQLAETKNIEMSKAQYDRIKEAALLSKAIDASDTVCYADQQVAVEAIMRTIRRGERNERRKNPRKDGL